LSILTCYKLIKDNKLYKNNSLSVAIIVFRTLGKPVLFGPAESCWVLICKKQLKLALEDTPLSRCTIKQCRSSTSDNIGRFRGISPSDAPQEDHTNIVPAEYGKAKVDRLSEHVKRNREEEKNGQNVQKTAFPFQLFWKGPDQMLLLKLQAKEEVEAAKEDVRKVVRNILRTKQKPSDNTRCLETLSSRPARRSALDPNCANNLGNSALTVKRPLADVFRASGQLPHFHRMSDDPDWSRNKVSRLADSRTMNFANLPDYKSSVNAKTFDIRLRRVSTVQSRILCGHSPCISKRVLTVQSRILCGHSPCISKNVHRNEGPTLGMMLSSGRTTPDNKTFTSRQFDGDFNRFLQRSQPTRVKERKTVGSHNKRRLNDRIAQCIQSFCSRTNVARDRLMCIVRNCN